MKLRTVLLILVSLIIFSLSSCSIIASNEGNEDVRFTGTWCIVPNEPENVNFGVGLKFSSDGTMQFTGYGMLDASEVSGKVEQTSGQTSVEINELEKAFTTFSKLYSATYNVIDDKTVKVTMSSLGLASESELIAYSFEQDILIFNGTKYKRIS